MSQTPDQLKELGRIFTAVGNGAQWQFASTTRPETWHEPEPGFCPLRAAEIGYLIRVKPWALPPPPEGREWHRGAEFTEADLPEGYRPMLVGETATDGDEFLPFRKDTLMIGWVTRATGTTVNSNTCLNTEAISEHRTKRPLPVRPDPVPLRKDDIPPNSALRNLRFIPDVEWVSVLKVSNMGVSAADGCFYEFVQLVRNGWEIQRPGEDWKPCSKEPI